MGAKVSLSFIFIFKLKDMTFQTDEKIPNKSNLSDLVSIVILNYNAGDLLLDCISSIFKSNYKNFEIILVDNVSKDQSHKKCKEKFLKVIKNVKKNFQILL